MKFYHPRKGRRSLNEMIMDIRGYLQEDPDAQYKVVIGTDSQTRENETIFVTALIVQRIGKGRFSFTRNIAMPPFVTCVTGSTGKRNTV